MQGVRISRFSISSIVVLTVYWSSKIWNRATAPTGESLAFMMGVIATAIVYELQLGGTSSGKFRTMLDSLDDFLFSLYTRSHLMRILCLTAVFGFLFVFVESSRLGHATLSVGTLVGALFAAVMWNYLRCRHVARPK